MHNPTNCARLSKKNRQELFKGKKGAKNISASLFFPTTNGHLDWDTFLSSSLICNAFHFRAKEIIGYKRETI